ELSSGIGRRIIRRRYEVIDAHHFVCIWIYEGQVNCNGIGRATAVGICIANRQEIAEAMHSKIALKSQVELREFFDRDFGKFGVFTPFKSVANQDSGASFEMLAVERIGVILYEYVCDTGHPFPKLHCQHFGCSKTSVY